MGGFRTEKDFLGEMEIPADALHGIHTARALENFPLSGRPVNPALIHAFGTVKLACAVTNHELGRWDSAVFDAISRACGETARGELDSHITVDALQGGAGTSANMAVNEVIANRALVLLGKQPGDYAVIDPLEDINLHQSTNDVYPTALKLASITELHKLEKALVSLLEAFQAREKEFAGIVKVGRTELQDAVLTTLGKSMSAFAEAFGRDRWRIYKCEERLRVVNLGGGAIGTGVSAPRKYIFKAAENLKRISGIGFARAENLVEATQNTDCFAEAAGILGACAANLAKVSGDLRLMSSGPDAGLGEIRLPALQAGSSIMPGKVNPVIPEAVTQAALRAMSDCSLVTQAVSMGNLELNAFMPLVTDALLEALGLLTAACRILSSKCVSGITADPERCRAHVGAAAAALTALTPKTGHAGAWKIFELSKAEKISIKEAAVKSGLVTAEEFDAMTSPEAVTKLGS
jgi:aspartate ammonia-lyase